MTPYDQEEAEIQHRLESGEITNAQANQELRELQRDYLAEAREAARDAYERELSRW
jgi:hypothetical protein